jgi:hypothetical protein
MSNRLVNHYLNQFERILFADYRRKVEVIPLKSNQKLPTDSKFKRLSLKQVHKQKTKVDKPPLSAGENVTIEAYKNDEVIYSIHDSSCKRTTPKEEGIGVKMISNAFKQIELMTFQILHMQLMEIVSLPGATQNMIFSELLAYVNQKRVLYLTGYKDPKYDDPKKVLRPDWPVKFDQGAVEFLIDNSTELFEPLDIEDLRGEVVLSNYKGDELTISRVEMEVDARYNFVSLMDPISDAMSNVLDQLSRNLKELLENVPQNYNPGEFFTENNGMFIKHYDLQYKMVAEVIRANKFQYFNHDDINAWIDLLCGIRLPKQPIKWLGPINYLVFWFKDIAVKSDPNNLKINEFNYIQFCHTQVPWELLSKHIILKNGEPLGKKHSNNSYESLKNGKIAMNKINHLLILSEKIPV